MYSRDNADYQIRKDVPSEPKNKDHIRGVYGRDLALFIPND